MTLTEAIACIFDYADAEFLPGADGSLDIDGAIEDFRDFRKDGRPHKCRRTQEAHFLRMAAHAIREQPGEARRVASAAGIDWDDEDDYE